jgi:predicted nucleic acid-binding protein
MRIKVFLDASYAIALSSSRDSRRQQAVQLASDLEAAKTRLITTRAVILEIGNALAKQRYRQAVATVAMAERANSRCLSNHR